MEIRKELLQAPVLWLDDGKKASLEKKRNVLNSTPTDYFYF